MNANGPITDPDLRALLQAHREDIFASLRCHMPGTIVSVNVAANTVSVKINAQALVYNQPQTLTGPLQTTPKIVDYPVLTDVPLFILSGGGFVLTMPVAAGDTCLLSFNDRDIDAWFQSGAIMPPNSGRIHSLSDAFAIVGFRSRANPVSGMSTTAAALRNAADTAHVAITAAGGVHVQATDGGEIAVGEDVSATSDNGGQLVLDAKVLLANGSGSLRDAMDLVITALTALNAKTGPSAAAQITAAQTALQALLRA